MWGRGRGWSVDGGGVPDAGLWRVAVAVAAAANVDVDVTRQQQSKWVRSCSEDATISIRVSWVSFVLTGSAALGASAR